MPLVDTNDGIQAQNSDNSKYSTQTESVDILMFFKCSFPIFYSAQARLIRPVNSWLMAALHF